MKKGFWFLMSKTIVVIYESCEERGAESLHMRRCSEVELRHLVVEAIVQEEANYEMRWAARLIPNFSIRCLKVFG
jgi:hypothetical protein